METIVFKETVKNILSNYKESSSNSFKEIFTKPGEFLIRRRVKDTSLYCDFIINEKGVFLYESTSGLVSKEIKNNVVIKDNRYVSKVLYLGSPDQIIYYTSSPSSALLMTDELADLTTLHSGGQKDKIMNHLNNFSIE